MCDRAGHGGDEKQDQTSVDLSNCFRTKVPSLRDRSLESGFIGDPVAGYDVPKTTVSQDP